MATSPGQRFVRRHDAARSSTSNTTAADISFDTAVISEGGYSWSSPEVTVDEAGFYLCMFDIGEVQLAATRTVGTLVPSVNTTDQTLYKARHRYLRNSGGNHGPSNGQCILNLSASDDVKVRNPGTVSGTDAFGNYATNVNQGGGFQLIRLPDGNFTEVQRTTSQSPITITYANATRPWLDSTATWTQITFTSEVQDDDNLYSGSGGDVTLAASTKYLICYGATFDGSSSQRHTHHLQLRIDGNNVQHSTGYERNNSSDGPPMQGMYLHETGGSAETLGLYGAVEQEDNTVGNTVGCDNAYVQVIELPSSAEWIHVDNGATDSLTTALAGTTTYYDTPLSSTLRADGDSNLSLDSGNNAVQNDSGGSLPVLAIGWHMWDRDAGTSGTRKHVWSYWDNGGTRLAYGISGGYNRGQQGNDDTHRLGFVAGATMDLANGADLSFVCRDPQSGANSDMGVYASTSRYFLGVQVLNLNTLQASSNATVEPPAGSLSLSGVAPSANVSLSAAPGAGSLAIGSDAPSAEIGHNRQTPDGSLSLAGAAPTVGLSQVVRPAQGCLNLVTFVGLELRGQAPTIDVTTTAGLIEEPPAGSLALAGQAPSQTVNHVVSPGSGALSIASAAPVVALDRFAFPPVVSLVLGSDQVERVVNNNRGPPVGSLSLAALAPSAEIAHNRSAPIGSLSLSSEAPTIGVSASPGVGALAFGSDAPSANTGDNKAVTPAVGGLSFASLAPTLGVSASPLVGSLVFGSDAGSAEISHNRAMGVGALTINGEAPSLYTDFVVAPNLGALTLSGVSPSAEIEHNRQTGVGGLLLVGQQPISINSADGPSIEVGSATLCFVGHSERWGVGLSLQGQAPAALVSAGVVEEPGAGALSLASDAPNLGTSVSPATGTLTFSSAQVSLALSIEVGVGGLLLQSEAPGSGASKSPASAALNFASQAPAIGFSVGGVAGSLQLQSAAPSAEIDHIRATGSAACVFASDAPTANVAQTSPSVSVPVAGLVLGSVAPEFDIANSGTAIDNPQATTNSPNNYEQCDFTGFRQLPGSLKMTWNKHAVRRKSWEERHPQEFVKSRSERLRGPRRPEQNDRFIGTDIDTVDSEDL